MTIQQIRDEARAILDLGEWGMGEAEEAFHATNTAEFWEEEAIAAEENENPARGDFARAKMAAAIARAEGLLAEAKAASHADHTF